MARVFLIQPPSSEPMRVAPIGLGFLAASLLQAGHRVEIADAAAPHGPSDPAELARRIAAFDPQLVGVHLKTLGLHRPYDLLADLRRRLPHLPAAWVAGGPHATVRPQEPLAHGFDLSVAGEAEASLVELADRADRHQLPADRVVPARPPTEDLDALPSPTAALGLFDPAWYGRPGPASFGGILASRGCPASCTFCCNAVTGRTFRAHSPERIAQEARRLRDDQGMPAFVFFDDSFAVRRSRVLAVAAALEAVGGLHWTASVHPTHLDADVAAALKRGGCGGLDLGAESGDPLRIKAIGKGVTVERVLRAVAIGRDAGLRVMVNVMFGWPDETEAELEATIAFVQRAADAGAMLNARGVLVPYPGTALYDVHHARYGFTDWWLDRDAPFEPTPFPMTADRDELRRAAAADAALARNFFRHGDAHLARIQEALALKADLSWRE